MIKTKSIQIEPKQSILDKYKEIISSIGVNTNQNVSSTNTEGEVNISTTSTNQLIVPQHITNDIHDTIAGLLHLNIGVGNIEDDYYCDQEHCTIIWHQKDSNVLQSKNRAKQISDESDDSCSTSTNEDNDSLCEQ